MKSVDDARRTIVAAMTPVPPEQVSLADALGRVLAAPVAARRTQPPVAVSAMDGYAVQSADVARLPATLRIIGYAPAGAAFAGRLGPGEAVRIFTGAPVPDGADAIVIQENTTVADDRVTVVGGAAAPGRFIRAAGLDFAAGDELLAAGTVLSSRDIGLAAAMNVPWLMVRRRPRVALLSTGDEVVMPGDPIGESQIVSSNGLALAAFVTAEGGAPTDLGIAPDSADALRAMAAGAAGADLLVTTGGASVGDHDLVQSVLGEAGLEVEFWRIAMRPGKPLIFGRLGETAFLGLPGNPVSALVCALIYLRPALRALSGIDADHLSEGPISVVLGSDLPENDERQDYLRARLTRGPDGLPVATPFARQDSAMFALLARADGLIVRPPFAPAARAGETVPLLPLSGSLLSI
jgi:molybdopterin molybdotransferase